MLEGIPPLKETPSQTAGPYVGLGLTPHLEGLGSHNTPDLGSGRIQAGPGPVIQIAGRIFDGSAAPVADAIVELWQANSDGNYAAGWGRAACDANGAFAFATVKPGSVMSPHGHPMAPHVTLWIVARGINIGLHTRLYFDDEAEANASDPVLNQIAEERRRSLIAARSESRGRSSYSLDIHLQGEDETVFFDI